MPDQERDWPDELQGMWDQVDERFRDESDKADFIDQAQELFQLGFVDGGSTETRQGYRDDFFALMEEFDISIEVFDWDDWRDWYEAG